MYKCVLLALLSILLILSPGCADTHLFGTSPISTTPITTIPPTTIPTVTILPTTTAPSTIMPMRLMPLVTWQGSGSKTTEPFEIERTPWAIEYTFSPEAPTYGIYANLFSVFVRQPNNILYLELPVNEANSTKTIKQISYVYDRGLFYLEITGISGDWVITVLTPQEVELK